MKSLFTVIFLCVSFVTFSQELIIKNDRIQRVLSYDGEVWRTTRFADVRNTISLPVKSEEFNILPMNTDKGYSINDFIATGNPESFDSGDTSFIRINYKPKSDLTEQALPEKVLVTYFAIKGQNHIHKKIDLKFPGKATVDRLEPERFITTGTATGGGRGEPVFIDNTWFTGLEYPAGYTRHTDGNTPKDYSRHYEKVGNYSFIDLDGRDVEPKSVKGMIRLMHFPGNTDSTDFTITSKTAVIGFAEKGATAEYAFMQYLATVWKKPVSFLHYNNWFEPKAKDLKGDALVNIWREFKKATAPYGVKLDAMVVDNGWQNDKSIWQPSEKHFSNGWTDVKTLTKKLKNEGVDFGFWLSVNGYGNNINWGVAQGYHEAKPNKYFSQYGRYYSLSSTKYKNEVLKQIPFIVKETGAVYYKHDFNELSDSGENNNHPATERHGHEANLDATIEILLATKKVNPEILQNLTNWIWFSPWWLMYSDYLWMLAGDDGTNGNWPEISTRAMASTDRDTYLWRMWGNRADRPLVPISRLMTHGIIKNSAGKMESPQDNLTDWLEYVLMHYGRGTLLKEWYISPEAMSANDWKALCTVDNWAKENRPILNNMTFVGGRPDEGKAYGYVGWQGEKGILVARNTNARTQKIIIPFDATVNFQNGSGQEYAATVLFPYREIYHKTFVSGKMMEIELPGYATMVFSFRKGNEKKPGNEFAKIAWNNTKKANNEVETNLDVPNDIQNRADLLLIGYPNVPEVRINGIIVTPKRTSKSQLNNFASYAKEGMLSETARDWNMQAIDLLPFTGKKITIWYGAASGFETHLLVERKTEPSKLKITGEHLLWPIANGSRRQTICLYESE